MTNDIEIKIPVELTAAMIIRAGVITDEARAKELAVELHDIVAESVKLYRADRRRTVKLPDDDPEQELVVLKDWHVPNDLRSRTSASRSGARRWSIAKATRAMATRPHGPPRPWRRSAMRTFF